MARQLNPKSKGSGPNRTKLCKDSGRSGCRKSKANRKMPDPLVMAKEDKPDWAKLLKSIKGSKVAESRAEAGDPAQAKLRKTSDRSTFAASSGGRNGSERRRPKSNRRRPKHARDWVGSDKSNMLSRTGKTSSGRRKLRRGNRRSEATLSGTLDDASGWVLLEADVDNSNLGMLLLG